MSEIGQTISHYRITEKLGGGMGVVCITEYNHLLRQEVAVRLLPHVFTADEVGEVALSVDKEFVLR